MNRRAFLSTLLGAGGGLVLPPTKVYSFIGSGIWRPDPVVTLIQLYGTNYGDVLLSGSWCYSRRALDHAAERAWMAGEVVSYQLADDLMARYGA